MKLRPLSGFLREPAGYRQEKLSRGEAASNGAAVRSMMDTPGWDVLLEMLERYRHNEQLQMMRSKAGGDSAYYERKLGEWSGLEMVGAIAEGIVAHGKNADAEMESGQASDQEVKSG